jgi:Zn-dependent protease with chaperone function
VLKSVFARRVDQEPGARLDLAEQPELRAVLEEVAAKIGTRPVDTVYMTPFADIAVMERAGLRGLLRGTAERCLVLGAGVIRGMKVLDFKAILAHEYGHFQNQDTAGGGFAIAVRRSLFTMALSLAKSGAATWYNPAWWFVRGFHRVFLTISQGASRLQEVLADRWAAYAYGSEAFERGLRHAISRTIRFEAHVDATLNEVVKAKRPLLNLYAYKPGNKPNVQQAIDEALEAEPSPFDSHPSPAHRIAWVRALGAAAPEPSPDDASPVWTLFSNRKELEQEMTDTLRERVEAAHGVRIPRPRIEKQEEEEPRPEEAAEA